MRLELNILRELLQLYVHRRKPWADVLRLFKREFKDITLLEDNYAEIKQQYDIRLSFQDDRHMRYNRLAG